MNTKQQKEYTMNTMIGFLTKTITIFHFYWTVEISFFIHIFNDRIEL